MPDLVSAQCVIEFLLRAKVNGDTIHFLKISATRCITQKSSYLTLAIIKVRMILIIANFPYKFIKCNFCPILHTNIHLYGNFLINNNKKEIYNDISSNFLCSCNINIP